MTDIRLLERTLADNLPWRKQRINFLACFLMALFQVKTVNLTEIAAVFFGRAKVLSHYKRIQRFLHAFQIGEAELARLLVRLMKLEAPFVLTFDRTEWKVGQAWVNVLMLAVVRDGVAIPLLWSLWSKKGCSNNEQRNELLDRFLKIFGAKRIKFLCADREFADTNWLPALRKRGINYRLRIKANATITDKRGKPMRADKVLQTMRLDEILVCRRRRKLWGENVYVSGVRRKNNENVIIISSQASKTILFDYAKRWEIETLFGCFKTRGFRLEDTHLKETQRVSRLLSLLALAFCWALLSGEWQCQQKPLKTKKHGRLEKSVFRVGFEMLRRLLYTTGGEVSQKQESKRLILLLSCT